MNHKLKISLIALSFLAVACQKNVNFSDVAAVNTGLANDPAGQCSVDLIEKPIPTNVLFIIDQSGSNVTGQFDSDGKGTDPEKIFRFGIMNRFIANHGSKEHLRWNLVTFAGTSAKSLVNDSGKPFTGTLAFIIQALDQFMKSKDGGFTPYKAALSKAKQLVEQNESLNPDKNSTLIAFLTDGFPTDYCANSWQTNCPGQIQENQIDEDVRKILAASSGNVKFSTIYYGPPDPPSSTRLERMAKVGGGQFVDLNQSSNIDLNDVIQVPEQNCQ